MRLMTSGVLAGAYKGGRASLKVTLTHTVDLDGNEKALCGQGSMAMYHDQPEAPPTCKRCLKKDPRFKETK